ncbi:Gfo/Idh/MocA family oxidoreductase [Rhodobacteraceae bacterium CCMM004]|nr:Gfo/Idh/MocA family oxidoreductase [Rhodobacteraceae bacterium CCMM004]
MTEPIQWGILGASRFARQQMAPAIHRADGAHLVGLATAHPVAALPFAEIAPGLEVFRSYDALLASDRIDAVYIPLPNHLHVEWTLKALESGKAVLCEKPLAMRAEDFDPVIAARDRSGLLAAEAYMIVHHPQWQRTRALIAEGAIGDLVHVDGVFSYDNSDDPDNIRNRPETGGGALPDIGVYTLGSVRYATGAEPERMQAHIVRENGVDVFSHVAADFPGFRFNMVVSMRMAPSQRMTFHGREGTLSLSTPFNAGVYDMARLTLERGMTRTVERFPADNHYVLQVEAFGRSMRDGDPYPCPLEFSRGTQAAIDMAFAAANRE